MAVGPLDGGEDEMSSVTQFPDGCFHEVIAIVSLRPEAFCDFAAPDRVSSTLDVRCSRFEPLYLLALLDRLAAPASLA
jgi:hypothetical protein